CGARLAATPAGLAASDLDRLRRYLPAGLVEELQFDLGAPAPRLLEQCQAHLRRLLATISSHLPPYLVQRVVQEPAPGRTGAQFLTGTLLLADISGFTPMMERLSLAGPEGAEELTAVVNRYLAAMLHQLHAQGGQLIKFGGDALLGLFTGPTSAAAALRAALNMQAAMSAFTQTQTSQEGAFPLRMSIGLRFGRFCAAELGTPEGMEYALFGADVNAVAAAEAVAEAGQVVTDAATLAAVSAPCQTRPGPAGYVIVETLEAAEAPAQLPPDYLPAWGEPSAAQLRGMMRLLDALTPYLPAGLLSRLSGRAASLAFDGEHRLVAVVFAQVEGLGQAADHLGPGQEAEIVDRLNGYYVSMAAAARRFGGVVNKIDVAVRGDKLLAFFGAPLAHEDDVERAARAAWAMQTALADLNRARPGAPISQRLGLSYGFVFAGYVGTAGRHEYTVMGDTVNLAARLMAVAAADTITVSADVQRKVTDLFDLTALGEVELKGKTQPYHVFMLQAPRAGAEPAHGQRDLQAALIGRTAEWEALTQTGDDLLAGRGQILLVTGEAGLGKTRLALELRQRLGAQVDWVAGYCLSYTEAVSYLPFQEMVRQLTGIRADDGEHIAAARLTQTLAGLAPADEMFGHRPYLLDFLNLPVPEAQAGRVRHLEAEALQRRTFLAISRLIEAHLAGAGQPLVIALDDLHWLDQASLALLEYLLPLVDRQPLLWVLLYRPERSKGCWRLHEKAARDFPHCSRALSLGRLTPESSAELLATWLPGVAWPAEWRAQLLSRADGNPFYLAELLRSLLDRGSLIREAADRWQIAGGLQALRIPETLHGVLMSRLDTLDEPTRQTAQTAAVAGRAFAYSVLSAVDPEAGPDLPGRLARLQQQEITYETQRTPERAFAFKHTLMQEVCYDSLLARTRRNYHGRIAAHLAALHTAGGAEAEALIPFIAGHAYIAQDWPRAWRYLRLAGERARRLFANAEAIDNFAKALACGEHLLPEETRAAAPRVQAVLGELLTITGHYDAAQEHLMRALAGASGDAELEAYTRRWLARRHELRGEYPAALDWIAQGLAGLAGRDSAEAAQLHLLAGLIHARQGRLDDAGAAGQLGLGVAERLGELAAVARAHQLMAVIALQRGDNLVSLTEAHQALALYTQTGDLAGQANTQNTLANADFNLGHWTAAEAAYRQARRMFEQLGDVYKGAMTGNNLGELALNQGRLDEALTFYQDALRGMQRIGGSSYVLGILHNNLGAAYLRRGELAPAREALALSQVAFEQAQARDFLPELHRHQAEAALAAGQFDEAEQLGRQSLELAEALEMQSEAGLTRRLLGEVALAGGAFAAAQTWLASSRELLSAQGEAFQAARSRLALAQLFTVQADGAAALAELDQCEAVFEQVGAALDLAAGRALRAALVGPKPA
ncbi:MAG: AAA family ATPase, partial [Anaerolineales bacterium]|nr:AAA family ATPase [Anaerolineales bacterium]